MRTFLGLLPVVFAVALPYELPDKIHTPLFRTGNTVANQRPCSEDEFKRHSDQCGVDFRYTTLIITQGHEKTGIICTALNEYKRCISLAMRMTDCRERGILQNATLPVQRYIDANHITCAHRPTGHFLYSNGSQVNRRFRPSVCNRKNVWKSQFQCAKQLQSDTAKVRRVKNITAQGICRALSAYNSCLNSAVEEERCERDAELLEHLEYFARVLSRPYRDTCSHRFTATKSPKMLRQKVDVQFQDGNQECDVEKATKEFFACGLIFSEIVSQNPGREKTCTAYADFRVCPERLNCNTSTAFYQHSYHAASVLLKDYDSYCRNFTPSQTLPSDVPGPPVPTPPGPCSCNRNVYMEKYFVCGLMYIFNIRDAIYSKNPSFQQQACDIIASYDTCLDNGRRTACCGGGEFDVQAALDYMINVLKKAPGGNCRKFKQKTSNFRFSGTLQHCDIREYAGSYFTCGTTFVRNIMPNPSVDEQCRFYKDFLHCKDLLVICRTQSDIKPSLDYFTSVLTEGFQQMCQAYKPSDTCEKLVLLKKYFECGVTYYQSKNEFSAIYANNPAQLCRLSADFIKCTTDTVFSNDCKLLVELYKNMKTVRKYVIHLLNEEHRASCDNPDDRLKRMFFGIERQTQCNQFQAVKKSVLCGVTFHKLLSSPSRTNLSFSPDITTALSNYSAVCPLVKELQFCLYASTHDTGCSEEMMLNAEIAVLKKHLLKEYEDVCGAMPLIATNETWLRRPVCEMKEFTQQWDSCDADMQSGIQMHYKNSTKKWSDSLSNMFAERHICKDLRKYGRCLKDSAGEHHCTEMTPQIKDLGGELYNRLQLKYCSGCSYIAANGLLVKLLFAAMICARVIL
ncbi:uncharacterized protein LOC135383441 [Ornithodoros turicata]|uniref:uncharacterized protein LOC135383441 n=1 Tax=Ornithodoros turicata TaxID=34597 RepID=UPI00313A1AD9